MSACVGYQTELPTPFEPRGKADIFCTKAEANACSIQRHFTYGVGLAVTEFATSRPWSWNYGRFFLSKIDRDLHYVDTWAGT